MERTMATFDSRRNDAWKGISGVPEVNEATFQPLRNSGQGIRQYRRILPLMHFASLAGSLPTLRLILPDVHAALKAHEDHWEEHGNFDELDYDWSGSLFLLRLKEAFDAAVPLVQGAPAPKDFRGNPQPHPIPPSFLHVLSGYYDRCTSINDDAPYKLQRYLTHAYEDLQFEKFKSSADKRTRVRILSQSSSDATSHLVTLPTSPILRLSEGHFRTMHQLLSDTHRLPYQ